MSEQRSFKQPWTIWSHAKLGITGEEWKTNPGNRPNLKFKVHANNPRFNIYMNDGKPSKAIAFALDPLIVQDIFQLINLVVSDKTPKRYTMELKSSYDHHGQRSEKPAVVSKVIVGRDSESVVYIAFQAKGEALAKFPFVPSFFADIKDEADERISKVLASEIRAKSWVRALDQIIGPYMAVHGKEPEEKPGTGGNKSGGWGGKASNGSEWESDVTY